MSDAQYLDTSVHDPLRRAVSEGFHFNCWIERWGHHTAFPVQPDDDENVRRINAFEDYTPDVIIRENCTFDDETSGPFFYDSQIRITSMFPPEEDYSELLGADLALHDAISMTAGGLYLDKAHAAAQRRFAAEFRKLPALPFSDVEGLEDPVCVRTLVYGGKTYLYALNREPYEIRLAFRIGGEAQTDVLEPFGLRTFLFAGEGKPTDIVTKLPDGVRDAYRAAADEARTALEADGSAGALRIAGELRAALDAGKLSQLRHLLIASVTREAVENYKNKK